MQQQTNRNTLLLAAGEQPTALNVVTTDNNILVSPKADSLTIQDKGNGALGNEKTIINNDHIVVDFNVDVKAKSCGTKGVAPKVSELLKICGMHETVNAGASVVYSPASSFEIGLGIVYIDGAKRDITGLAGDFSLSGKIGEIANFTFNLKGYTTLEETASENPIVSLDTNKNTLVKSASIIAVGGDEIDLEEFDLKMNATIKEIYATKTKKYYIADFAPTLKVKAVKTKGNQTHWTQLATNTKKAVKIVLGSEEGQTIEILAPFCASKDLTEADSDGKMVYERTWTCENSDGNDNFSITYK